MKAFASDVVTAILGLALVGLIVWAVVRHTSVTATVFGVSVFVGVVTARMFRINKAPGEE